MTFCKTKNHVEFLRGIVYSYHKFGNLAARKDNINNVEKTLTYDDIEQRQSFDAWGNRRNARTWHGSADDIPLFDRGYTGQEHLHAFGLINMNGRVYDPTTSSFLSPDNYVQNPTRQQGFNRYAYCLYNPLRYTDPSGFLCENPPYWQQVQSYLMCMNAENAEALNNVGIDNVQVASSTGYGGGYVSYQCGGEWHTVHYNGYVDYGYHENWNNTPSLDAYAPMESSGMTGPSGHGGSGCGSSNSNNSHLKHAIGSTVAGRYFSYNEKKYYNKETRTWTGKNGKQYGLKFKGNQYTGGIYKFGRRMSRLFKIGNVSLAFGNAVYIWSQYDSGEIDGYEMIWGEAANLISQLGWFGFFFNIGWEGMQYLMSTEQYQELKFKIQYNKELRYLGEPNQVNQELWDEWYKNYRP